MNPSISNPIKGNKALIAPTENLKTPEEQITAILHTVAQKDIHLHLNSSYRTSPEHQKLIIQFLREMTLTPLSTPDAQPLSGASPIDLSSSSPDSSSGYEPNPAPANPSNKLHSDFGRLKRKGFTFNPICIFCKEQFDSQDNPKECCVCHPGGWRS